MGEYIEIESEPGFLGDSKIKAEGEVSGEVVVSGADILYDSAKNYVRGSDDMRWCQKTIEARDWAEKYWEWKGALSRNGKLEKGLLCIW